MNTCEFFMISSYNFMSAKRALAITGATTAIILAALLVLYHPGNNLSAQLNTPVTAPSSTTAPPAAPGTPPHLKPKVRPSAMAISPQNTTTASAGQPTPMQQIVPISSRNTDNNDRDILLPGSYGYESYGKKTAVSDPGIVCNADIYNCEDFSTPATAQHIYDYCLKTTGKDIHELDSDHNGVACESAAK